jgi:excisionase family DNA binding protein
MTNTLLTPDEAAQMLGLSPFTVRRLLRQGELPGRKIGKRQWRIRRVDLEEYLGATGKPLLANQSQQSHGITSRIEQLAAEQGVSPVDDFDRLISYASHSDEGDTDESVEDFLAPIYELRDSSPAYGEV